MTPASTLESTPQVAILVLNYHQPEATLACVRSLLEREGPGTRVVWIENDAAAAGDQAEKALASSGIPYQRLGPNSGALPPSGTVGFLPVEKNLGYAGGNNVGLRLAHRLGAPYAWVLNNDTVLESGSSLDLIQASKAHPGIALWGTRMRQGTDFHVGGRLDPASLYASPLLDADGLADPMAYVSGCSLFFRLEEAAAAGFLPDRYFLYYEDPAFSMVMRKRGHGLGAVRDVIVQHDESLSSGRRSALTEYYNKRNRWFFMQDFFPELLKANRRSLPYTLQKYLLRFRLRRAWLEWLAYRDFKKGLDGRTARKLHGST